MIITGPALTVPDRLDALPAKGLARDPDGTALEDLVTSLSWRQLDERVQRLVAGYGTLPLQVGDRVASLMPNRLWAWCSPCSTTATWCRRSTTPCG